MSIVQTVKNEYADWKFQQFLKKASGDTTVRLYNDLKYIMRDMRSNDDHLSEGFKQRLSVVYNEPDFVVDHLIEKSRQYLKKRLL